MLILSRRPGESLVMTTESGEEIRLIVLQNTGRQVRMGVDANHNVTIDREEIHRKRQAERIDE